MKCIIDIKTGKVMPWTALQLSAYCLLDTPVEFNEDGHVYTLDGARLPSVTGILQDEGFIDNRFFDNYSRDRGTYVHLATHLDDSGDLDEATVDPFIMPYLEAWRRFKKESGFVVEQSEISLASRAYSYAGTIDRIGRFPAGGIARAAVELHNDGTYKLYPFTDRNDKHIWLSAVAVHRWKQNNLRGGK
jgi:hypothetical protein